MFHAMGWTFPWAVTAVRVSGLFYAIITFSIIFWGTEEPFRLLRHVFGL